MKINKSRMHTEGAVFRHMYVANLEHKWAFIWLVLINIWPTAEKCSLSAGLHRWTWQWADTPSRLCWQKSYRLLDCFKLFCDALWGGQPPFLVNADFTANNKPKIYGRVLLRLVGVMKCFGSPNTPNWYQNTIFKPWELCSDSLGLKKHFSSQFRAWDVFFLDLSCSVQSCFVVRIQMFCRLINGNTSLSISTWKSR